MKKLFISGLIIFIIFFASGAMTWFTIDKNKYYNRHYTKTINSKIEHLSISTVTTNVNVISGKKLAVYFTGDNKINVTKNNKRLSIKEKRAVDRGYGLNFNPFHSNNRKLTIVVPEKDLKSLNIQSLLGEIDLNQVNLKHVSLETDRIIQLKRSELNQVNIESSKANFYITDCLIREGRMKLDKGITHVKNSTLSDTVFLVNRGDISMTDMKSNNDIKASTQRGNINYHFGEKPKNTLLKLHPGHGNKEIKNRYFDKGKVGNSDNILEFYTVDGDIKIE